MLHCRSLTLAILAAVLPAVAHADPMLADFDYPWPVQRHSLVSQGVSVEMAYMDVAPEGASKGTIVLLHGKNFCGATWEGVARDLLSQGYRVVLPDQIGFCKSSKPARYQYGLHTLAANTRDLLDALSIDDPIMMGHSMGGMLAARYAAQYPAATEALVMVNPIGLEDWRGLGVPNATVDALFEGEKATTRERIQAYQQATYYAGTWSPDYDVWVDMLWSMYDGEGGDIVAWHQALASDMIFNQPIVHDLHLITAPTLLILGEQDNTALGKGRAPEALRAKLGDYAKLGPATVARIPQAKLVVFDDLGHSPHIQDPARFGKALKVGLKKLKR